MKLINRAILLFAASALIIILISFAGRIHDHFERDEMISRLKADYADNILNLTDCMQRKGELFLFDNTFWDDMVKFISTGNRKFAFENIDVGVNLYGIDFIWVFNSDFKLVYSVSKKNKTRLVPELKSEVIKKTFAKERLTNFFIKTNSRIYKISGASIHPTRDEARITPPAGYMLIGFQYDSIMLERLKSGNGDIKSIHILLPGETAPPETEGFVRVFIPMCDHNGIPAAFLAADFKSDVIELAQSFNNRRIIISSAILIILMIVLTIFYRWIISPTNHLYRIMKYNLEISPDVMKSAPAEFRFLGDLIKRRMEAEEELKKANAQKEIEREKAEKARGATAEFLANMSHEIRTPITCLVGFSEMLGETGLSDEQKMFADGIANSSQTILKLINGVLDLSKIEAGKFTLAETVFNPCALVNSISLMLKGMNNLPAPAVSFLNRLDPQLYVTGDGTRIRQVLLNLTSNAIKYTPSGEVTIIASAEFTDSSMVKLTFTVSDTGLGLSEEQLYNLFNRFEQVHQGEYLAKGTGLGLVITKSIIDRMNGELKVESTQGKGSTFTVVLTLPEAEAPLNTDGNIQRNSFNLYILIVDDNKINYIILSRILEKLGCSSDHADNGASALEMLALNQYDAVMMDCQIPEMDGFEITARIRQSELPYRSIPVIAVTADVMDDARKRCFDAGMNGYVIKPYNINEIAAALSTAKKNVTG